MGSRGTLTFKPGSQSDSLSTGIVKADGNLQVSQAAKLYWDGHSTYRLDITTNTLKKAIAADAAEAFGQKLWTFPAALIKPRIAYAAVTLSTPTGLSATAGEIGLGSVVGTGAVAVLTGTSTFVDFAPKTTIANLVAGTPATEYIRDATLADTLLDCSGTAKSLFLNIASTWNQTAAEYLTFSARVVFEWTQVVL